MKALVPVTAALLLSLSGAIAPAVAAPPAPGLAPARVQDFDHALLRPGADLRAYRKILLDPVEMSFEKDWLGDVNRRGTTLSGRVTGADAKALLDAARAAFDASWAQELRAAGYEIVAAPGEGVLRLTPRVVGLYVHAPVAATTGIHRDYVEEAGFATLQLEVRDSRSGDVLGQVRDRRTTARSPVPMRVVEGTNERELGRLFAAWAGTAARGLGQAHAR